MSPVKYAKTLCAVQGPKQAMSIAENCVTASSVDQKLETIQNHKFWQAVVIELKRIQAGKYV